MTKVMPQIETVVMLMLENRSLDTVLGWLHNAPTDQDGHKPKVTFLPPGSDPRFNGIRAGMTNAKRHGDVSRTYPPAHGTQGFEQSLRTPRADPWEGMAHVQYQMYADENGPPTTLGWGPNAPMTGFAWDYPALWDRSGEVMGAYTAEQLPVLYGLAENFAVSDAWFSPVPTETDPNRAFAICGTSLGATGDFPMRNYDAPTIFNGLDDAGVEWGIYWQYNGWLDMDPVYRHRQCWTVDRFPQIGRSLDAGHGRVAPYAEFFRQLADDSLPKFCYIEPYWGWGIGSPDGTDFVGLQGNDYHCPTWVGTAEADLNQLYEALQNSNQWEHMLFIISFDEHGGTWDHVSPPATLAPDQHRGTYSSHQPPFDFTRLGPRVPTLLVSPYVVPGTVFRPPAAASLAFDHTSFIATILAWAGTSSAFLKTMGRRVANAPLFDHAMSDVPFLNNRPEFSIPIDPVGQPPNKGPHGFPFDVSYLPWDELRAIGVDPKTGDRLSFNEVIERVRLLEKPTG